MEDSNVLAMYNALEKYIDVEDDICLENNHIHISNGGHDRVVFMPCLINDMVFHHGLSSAEEMLKNTYDMVKA